MASGWGGEGVREQDRYFSAHLLLVRMQNHRSLPPHFPLCIVQNSYFEHIMSKTKARIHLRGRGSGYMEPTSGRESFEALYIYLQHSTPEGLKEARTLCDDLVKHVHKEYETFKQQRTAYRPPFPYTPFPGWGMWAYEQSRLLTVYNPPCVCMYVCITFMHC